MQKTFKFAVTVGRSENVALEKLAQTWAVKFGVKYVERGSRGSLGFLLAQEQVEALLVATNKGPQVYTASGTFFFHPSMAVLRVQRLKKHESDHFSAALALKPGMRVLDCTMGLASDAVVASFITGRTGTVRRPAAGAPRLCGSRGGTWSRLFCLAPQGHRTGWTAGGAAIQTVPLRCGRIRVAA